MSHSSYINDEFFADMFQNDSYRIYNIGNFKKGDNVKVKFEYNHYRLYFYNDYPYFVQVNEENLILFKPVISQDSCN